MSRPKKLPASVERLTNVAGDTLAHVRTIENSYPEQSRRHITKAQRILRLAFQREENNPHTLELQMELYLLARNYEGGAQAFTRLVAAEQGATRQQHTQNAIDVLADELYPQGRGPGPVAPALMATLQMIRRGANNTDITDWEVFEIEAFGVKMIRDLKDKNQPVPGNPSP